MGKVVRLTESDLNRIVRRTIMEMEGSSDKLNPPGFNFLGEKSNNEIYGQNHGRFRILLVVTPKQTSEYGDFFYVKCMIQLVSGETIDVGQQEFGKSVHKISGNDDIMLKRLIHSAKNLGEFRVSYDNTPRMK